MQLPSLVASIGLAAFASGAVVPRQVEPLDVDLLLPVPIPTEDGAARIQSAALPQEITWTIEEVIRDGGNASEALPSANMANGQGPIEERQIFGGKDDRFLETRTTYPFNAMGRVLRTWTGASSWCSGSIVGNRVALMARHCLGDGVSYRFQPAYYNGERFPSAGVTHVIRIPGENGDNGGCGWKDDWALLILDKPLNTGYLGFRYFTDSMSNAALNFWNYGYPQDKSGSGQLPYASQNFKVWKTTGCGSSEGGPLNTDADVSPGQSGGPVWIPESDGRYQYGVYVGYAGTSHGILSHGGNLINAIIKARNDFP